MKEAKVQDLMTAPVVTLAPDDTIRDAARTLASNRISGAPVVAEGRIVGMIAESDIVRAALPPAPGEGLSMLDALLDAGAVEERVQRRVAEVMGTLVVEIAPDASVRQAAAEMERRGVNRLPVVNDRGELVGLLSRADLVKALAGPPD